MFDNEVKKGTLQLIVLSFLDTEPMYGYQIIQRVHEKTNGTFQWREASLYPALYRLEENEWIKGKWMEGQGERRRKYYFITAKGKKELASQRARWQQISGLVDKLALGS